MRVEWDLDGFAVPAEEIGQHFHEGIAERFGMRWGLHFSDETPRMAIFVSKLSHCLFDILSRRQSGDWKVEVPLIISNHPDLEPVAEKFGVEYHVFSAAGVDRHERERKQLELLQEHRVDFIVLARYMQILTNEFVAHYPNRIINIHHSFLPAFPGARPYHAAYARGVKIIGATSHYVTAELDAGPIIEQDVVRVGYKDAVEDLIRKGQDLETVVLARAIWCHLKRKILVYGDRTICFI
jgi:formyltetrahydrofolate deformylase